MLISNKHFTPVIGLDIHIVILFGFPIPLPHPYIGFVIDPMDYIPFIGATTKINHVPRGKSDTSGLIIILFHIPMGGPFLLAPMIGHDSVNFFGSKKVKVEGNMMSPSGHMLMTCNDIGIPLSLQPGKKLKPIPSMYLPTSFSIPLSFGKPVMVGGPYVPDWAGALLNLVMSFGFGALMKGVGHVGKKALTKFNHALKGKLGSNKLSRFLCKKGFEPVDLVQGIVIYDGMDFELPGPIPVRWERSWNSDSSHQGLLGHGHHLCYDMQVQEFPAENVVAVLLGDGRSAIFDAHVERDYNRTERMTLTRTDLDEYLLFNHTDRLYYQFKRQHPLDLTYRLQAIRNEAGFMISFHYNGTGRLLQIIDSAGRQLKLGHDTAGRILRVTAVHKGAQRLMVSYAYNEEGDLAAITDALGQTTRIVYKNHLMVEKTDRNGQTFYWTYDQQKRCIHTWGDGGILEGRIAYHADKGYNEVTNGQGHTTTYYYTAAFVVTQVKDPLGNSTFTDYTDHFEIYREIDEEGNATGYTYDERGNRSSIVKPDGSTYAYHYDEEDHLVLVKGPDGGSRTYTYYDNGLLHTLTEADGGMTVLRYNERNLLAKVEDHLDRETVLSFDEDGNLAELILPDGSTSSWEYDAWGSCTRFANPLRQEQYYKYDALARVTEILLSNGNRIRMAYNAYENVVQIADNHHRVNFEYTAMGSLKLREENGTKIHFLYNRDEQLTTVVNEHGEYYKFARNGRGDIIQETGFDGVTQQFRRDATGKVIRVQRPGGRWTNYEYNVNGKLTRAEYSDGSWELYSYDRCGFMTEAINEHSHLKMLRDDVGRVIAEYQDGYVVNSTYTKDGYRAGLSSNLGAAITMKRNAAGQLSGMQAAVAGIDHPWVVGIERDSLGMEILRSLPGGVESRKTYDRMGLLTGHTVQTGQGMTRNRSYRWNAAQQLKQITNVLQGGNVNFSHNELGELAWAEYEDGQFDYRLPDKMGNVYQAAGLDDRKYGQGGRLQETPDARFDYDEEGRLVKKVVAGGVYEYTWAGNGMLKKVVRPDGKEVQFRYDALCRRIEKQFGGMLTRFVWDGNVPLHEWSYPVNERPQTVIDELGNVIQDHPEPVPAERLITWVFEDNTFNPVARIVNGKTISIINDHLGTPCEAYDEAGDKVWECELDIYGKVRKFAGDRLLIPFRYAGQYEDKETDLYYNRFRYYSPGEGIFISQDPIRLLGGALLYRYVGDPSTMTDPLGLHTVLGAMNGQPVLRPGSNSPFWNNVDGSGSNSMADSGLGRLGDSENLFMEHLEQKYTPDELKGSFVEIESMRSPKGSALPPCEHCAAGMQEFANRHNATVVYTVTEGKGSNRVGTRRVKKQFVFKPTCN
jgi:RHS repeat-associated protein